PGTGRSGGGAGPGQEDERAQAAGTSLLDRARWRDQGPALSDRVGRAGRRAAPTGGPHPGGGEHRRAGPEALRRLAALGGVEEGAGGGPARGAPAPLPVPARGAGALEPGTLRASKR